MIIKTAFENNEKIPIEYTADGQDINPEIIISEIPKNSKTLVLVVDDPDAQRVAGFTWIHWVIFNIPVSSNKLTIQKNSIPGTAGKSTYKKISYGGPSPPRNSGVHHYHFKVYALDKTLDLKEMAELEEIMEEIGCHILDKQELVGTYWRE